MITQKKYQLSVWPIFKNSPKFEFYSYWSENLAQTTSMYACQNAKFRFGIYWQFWCSEATPTNHSSGYRTHYARSFQYFLLSVKRYLLWVPLHSYTALCPSLFWCYMPKCVKVPKIIHFGWKANMVSSFGQCQPYFSQKYYRRCC